MVCAVPQSASSDPRLTLARPDLAELALEGVLKAGAYRPTRPMQGVLALSDVRAGPSTDAPRLDQLAFGEVFDVLEVAGGWAWGRARRDGIVGHVAVAGLSETVLEPTHRVSALTATADAETGAGATLGLNALVTIEEVRGGRGRATRLGWLSMTELADFHAFEREPAAVAERFAGAPHVPGGRDAGGLDAPGLVQQALYACGIGCPRAWDQQQALGREAPADRLMRGDLVFWSDHVAMMLDAERLIHAEVEAGVRVETLAEIIARRAVPEACRRL